jgi:hypothetical protein
MGAANTVADVEGFLRAVKGLVKRLKGLTAMAV